MDEKVDITRALRDKDYYNSLTAAQKAQVPNSPVGEAGLSDTDLEQAAGGNLAITGTGSGETCNCTKSTSGTGGGLCECCDKPASD
jgi:mersacidin/lichenicidin family type 2 lantibiotic